MKINNILKLFILTITLIFSVNLAMASTGLTVTLSNQNPEIVAPGNFVFVNVKVSNSGSDPIQDAKITMIENNNFKIAQGNDIYKNLGIIPSYSDASTSSSYSIAKFKVLVDPNTPSGLNDLKFKLDTSTGVYEYTFQINVKQTNPKVTISDLNIDTIEAGDTKTLSFKINNENSIDLKNVIVNLNLDSVENKVLSTLKGTNQFIIKNLNSFESQNVSFQISVSPDAIAKQYLLPITVDFEDSLGNTHNQSIITSVKVFSNPILSFKLDSQESFSAGNQKLVFAIANPGTSSIKGLQVELLDSDNYIVIDGDSHYVGNLNPDDFQTIQSSVFIKKQSPTNIKVKLTYLDSYNKEQSKVVLIPVKIYSDAELKSMGLSTTSSSGTSKTSLFIIGIICLLIGFFIGKRIGYNKGKKKKN